MTKKLYVLTNEQAKWLGYYARLGWEPELEDALTPLDRDAAVERMARAIADLEPGEPWPTNEELGGGPTGTRDDEYRHECMDRARAALDALHGAPRKGQS